MKGAVFTEFLEMVENKFGAETADQIIENSQLASEGAYTAVGTYDHQELLQLVTQLGKSTATPIPNLVRTFGQHLFGRFALLYPQFVGKAVSTFALLESIEGLVLGCIQHFSEPIEVRKEDLSGGQGTSARFILIRRD